MDSNLVLQMSLYFQGIVKGIVCQNETQGLCCETNFGNLADQIIPQRDLSVSRWAF